MNSKEMFSRDTAHIIVLHLNILTPVPELMKFTYYQTGISQQNKYYYIYNYILAIKKSSYQNSIVSDSQI